MSDNVSSDFPVSVYRQPPSTARVGDMISTACIMRGAGKAQQEFCQARAQLIKGGVRRVTIPFHRSGTVEPEGLVFYWDDFFRLAEHGTFVIEMEVSDMRDGVFSGPVVTTETIIVSEN